MNKQTALLLIDFQCGFKQEAYFGGNRNNPQAEANARRLLDHFREKGYYVIHTRHNSVFEASPLRKGQPGNDTMDLLRPLPSEEVFEKKVNSAFIGTQLKEYLDANGIINLVLTGLITNHCVSTTARMAGNYGYSVTVVSDATATFDRKGLNGEVFDSELVHQVSLATLQDEFGQVCNTASVLTRFR